MKMAEVEYVDIPDTAEDTICNLCFAEFLDSDDLMIHVNQMHNNEPSLIKCQFCSQRFGNLEFYASHLRNDHLVHMKSCKYCTRVFDDIDTFERHETKHYLFVNKSKYTCSVCKHLFNNIVELEKHEYKMHRDSGDGVFLTECLPYLSTVLNINAKTFMQALGDDVVYICLVCETSTSNLDKYIDHLKAKECRSFACNTCCSVYINKYRLVRHFAVHPLCSHRFRKESKQCPECYKMYDITIWKDHCKNCKTIKCKQCKLVFPTVNDLSNHLRVHPSTLPVSVCKFCNKDFAGEAAVVKHIERTHKADFHLYKYLCVYCNAIFKHPSNLFTHYHTRHKELEPYTCQICNRKFSVRKRFTLHIKLDHKSIGYVEFDENYHVSFADKKPANPFKPEQLLFKGNDSLDAYYLPDAIRYRGSNSDEDIDSPEKANESLNQKNTTIDNVEGKCKRKVKKNSDIRNMKAKIVKRNKQKVKMKIRPKTRETSKISDCDSSEDEPLLELRKKQQRLQKLRLRNNAWNRHKKRIMSNDKKRFVCGECNKNCYTYQNYNNHISTHYNNVETKCVKCLKVFQAKEDLDQHYLDAHSTSQLTETLRNLLERRKKRSSLPAVIVSNTERFMNTIKSVPITHHPDSATLKINDGLSVQKFIESFVPEDSKFIKNMSCITIKPVNNVVREPKIKMIKCNMKHINLTTKLAKPVRFKSNNEEPVKATFNLITAEMLEQMEKQLTDVTQEYGNNLKFEDVEIDDETVQDTIPEVAEEIMLEVSEEVPKQTQQQVTNYTQMKYLVPIIPSNCKQIVQIEGVEQNKEVTPPPATTSIELPDGTKLVNVNPLAHLLGDKHLEYISKLTKNKYYKPKQDFESAITKAMLQLKTPAKPPKKKKKITEQEVC